MCRMVAVRFCGDGGEWSWCLWFVQLGFGLNLWQCVGGGGRFCVLLTNVVVGFVAVIWLLWRKNNIRGIVFVVFLK